MTRRHVIERNWDAEIIEPLSQLAENPNLPVVRGRVTLWRWATRGVAINGTVVKLPTVPTGGGGRNLHSSVGAVRDFLKTVANLHGKSGDHWDQKPVRRIKE